MKAGVREVVEREGLREVVERKLRDKNCVVFFVCESGGWGRGSVRMLDGILGESVREVLGERFVEDIFRS